MPRFVAGVNGGGSHSSACALHVESGRFFEAESGPSNVRSVGLKTACDAIEQAACSALEKARKDLPCSSAPRLDALACCLSGAGRDEERQAIETELKARNLAEKIIVRNDAEAVLAAAMVFDAGIAAIAGTGSFVWGRNASGRVERADGWGPLLGDGSGAFRIALEALRAACRFHDGSGPQTRLLDRALKHFAIRSAGELIPLLARPDIPRVEIAAFCPAVFEAAQDMDPVAVGIVEEAVAAFVRSVYAVRDKLFEHDASVSLVLGGGLARGQSYFQERFFALARGISARDQVLCPEDSEALGAARIALRETASPQEIVFPQEASRRLILNAAREAEIQARHQRVFEECAALLTEQRNPKAEHLDELPIAAMLELMNEEDAGVAPAVRKALPGIVAAVEKICAAFASGGRLFYIGAGTSGRLGCLDAAECPPTFGTPPEMVQAVIAGGVATLLRSREGAEDDTAEAVRQLQDRRLGSRDVLAGLAASRRTPYVRAGLAYARSVGAGTILITCSPPDAAVENVDILIAPVVGPEVVMGSTRLKAATAQKMILNMMTTAAMVRSGKVYQGMMVDLQLSCDKLSERAKRTLMMLTGLEYDACVDLLSRAGGSVKRALVMAAAGCSAREADAALRRSGGFVRSAIREAQK